MSTIIGPKQNSSIREHILDQIVGSAESIKPLMITPTLEEAYAKWRAIIEQEGARQKKAVSIIENFYIKYRHKKQQVASSTAPALDFSSDEKWKRLQDSAFSLDSLISCVQEKCYSGIEVFQEDKRTISALEGGLHFNPVKGSFTTYALKMSPFFGRSLADLAYKHWNFLNQPSSYVCVERGPGKGVMAVDFIDYVLKHIKDEKFIRALSYVCYDFSANLLQTQKEHVQGYLTQTQQVLNVQYIQGNFTQLNRAFPSESIHLFLSNEDMDDLPCMAVQVDQGEFKVLVFQPLLLVNHTTSPLIKEKGLVSEHQNLSENEELKKIISKEENKGKILISKERAKELYTDSRFLPHLHFDKLYLPIELFPEALMCLRSMPMWENACRRNENALKGKDLLLRTGVAKMFEGFSALVKGGLNLTVDYFSNSPLPATLQDNVRFFPKVEDGTLLTAFQKGSNITSDQHAMDLVELAKAKGAQLLFYGPQTSLWNPREGIDYSSLMGKIEYIVNDKTFDTQEAAIDYALTSDGRKAQGIARNHIGLRHFKDFMESAFAFHLIVFQNDGLKGGLKFDLRQLGLSREVMYERTIFSDLPPSFFKDEAFSRIVAKVYLMKKDVKEATLQLQNILRIYGTENGTSDPKMEKFILNAFEKTFQNSAAILEKFKDYQSFEKDHFLPKFKIFRDNHIVSMKNAEIAHRNPKGFKLSIKENKKVDLKLQDNELTDLAENYFSLLILRNLAFEQSLKDVL